MWFWTVFCFANETTTIILQNHFFFQDTNWKYLCCLEKFPSFFFWESKVFMKWNCNTQCSAQTVTSWGTNLLIQYNSPCSTMTHNMSTLYACGYTNVFFTCFLCIYDKYFLLLYVIWSRKARILQYSRKQGFTIVDAKDSRIPGWKYIKPYLHVTYLCRPAVDTDTGGCLFCSFWLTSFFSMENNWLAHLHAKCFCVSEFTNNSLL